MSRGRSPSFGRIYGLSRVTRIWGLSRATVYRSRAEMPEDMPRRRPGPIGACSDAELADFQSEIKCLGIEASPSFVREPEGNGVAERFIRTLKENLLWVRTFPTIEELRVALVEFAERYNKTWLVARHGYKTPDQVRAEQLSVAKENIPELPLAA
jgi:transposase InsO family protein